MEDTRMNRVWRGGSYSAVSQDLVKHEYVISGLVRGSSSYGVMLAVIDIGKNTKL